MIGAESRGSTNLSNSECMCCVDPGSRRVWVSQTRETAKIVNVVKVPKSKLSVLKAEGVIDSREVGSEAATL